jgi:hypothetical protein
MRNFSASLHSSMEESAHLRCFCGFTKNTLDLSTASQFSVFVVMAMI